MDTINDIIYNISNYFNSNNIPFVVGGGYGVKLLCDLFSIHVSFDVNNLDIFYLANTPITTSCISSYRRMTEPRTTTTYTTEEGFNINLTMVRNNYLSFIHNDYLKIMHPNKLIGYYMDDFEMTDTMRFKYIILESIITNINMGPIHIINKNNTIEIENQIKKTFKTIPLARRLLTIEE